MSGIGRVGNVIPETLGEIAGSGIGEIEAKNGVSRKQKKRNRRRSEN